MTIGSNAVASASPPAAILTAFVTSRDRTHHLSLLVEGLHCAKCIRKIETRLSQDPAVTKARVNLTLRQLSVDWVGDVDHAVKIGETVAALGYGIAPYEAGALSSASKRAGHELLQCLAISGFASSNTMMLAWAVWAGQAQGMPASTQALLNWMSALIAVPAVAFAGRPFYRSAFAALGAGRTNIDVPIVAALLLAAAISVFDLVGRGPDVYFDSVTMLLFVLLVGRYLEYRVRARARAEIERLVTLKAQHATIVDDDGSATIVAASTVAAGTMVIVAPGETVPVDGCVAGGTSTVDRSAVTGETLPVKVREGEEVFAGYINCGIPLVIRTSRTAAESHLSEILRLVEQAQLQKGRVANLADSMAVFWTPAVHGIALATFAWWWLGAGAGAATALLHAVTVLIIACPCAIGLAIPAVQVAVIGGLLKKGILVRSGEVLERLAKINRVAFDKTGTLTLGRPVIVKGSDDEETNRLAASLAAASKHPFARALSQTFGRVRPISGIHERPGEGLEADIDGAEVRLGSASFCGIAQQRGDGLSEVWLNAPWLEPARFVFADAARPDARSTAGYFEQRGIRTTILSGDREPAVALCAADIGVGDYRADLKPADKAALLSEWRASGHKTLMLGDGLNDAPALAEAHVSASFAHGVAAAQATADIVLPAERLSSIVLTHRTAVRAAAIVRQNLGFAAAYNAILIPVAVLGHASPLIAAAAMSASSIAVTLNSLRARPAEKEASL